MKNTNQQPLKDSIRNLEKAIARLEEAITISPDNSIAVDGTIQRFEFVIELSWKMLKRALALEGIEAKTPREAMTEAYKAKWIDNENLWLSMLKDRNETSHIYDEKKALEIYLRIKTSYAGELRRILEFIKGRM